MVGRRVTANIVMTLDGHTTGPGGAFDMGPIAPHGMSDQMRDALVEMTTATTVLLGRANYEGFGGFWPGVAEMPGADPRDRQFSRWLTEVDKIVFSTTLDRVDWQHARLAEADPAETVRRLRDQGDGDIRVLSSQSVIRQLLTPTRSTGSRSPTHPTSSAEVRACSTTAPRRRSGQRLE